MDARSRHDITAAAWWAQARRDLRAADHLLDGGFDAHAMACAHLAVEKALKGVYRARFDANPPVTHDLDYLLTRTGLSLPRDLQADLDVLRGRGILMLYAPPRTRTPAPAEGRTALAAAHALLNWITDRV